ncbi:MAG: DNA primase DnaG [Nanoarchaeota archaeon]|nr:DNA primase DnaG [Nanoarchaeota archaeon]
MGKISPVSAKYIVHATIEVEGTVDRPDVIGAVFGQTEGLLGSDLELRELQRSGRIGRIEVEMEVKAGKSKGTIIIPSSLDKAETAIIAAALEIIQRIGPCNAKTKVISIEDIRISKRQFVIERAKELLKTLIDTTMPDSREIADEVAYSVRVMEIVEYGKDRLPSGPAIDESDEVMIVEGRADVLNLLKHGFKNAIAMNGTSVPQTIIELSRKKVVTVFVDGDRGGDLIIKELAAVAEIDFITKAPDGKEVEEITQKEIHKALRSKIAFEQAKLDVAPVNSMREIQRIVPGEKREEGQREQRFERNDNNKFRRPTDRPENKRFERPPMQRRDDARPTADRMPPSNNGPVKKPSRLSDEDKKKFRSMLEDLIGTRGANILDENLNVLGKVPVAELANTIGSLQNVHAVVFDGIVDRDIANSAGRAKVKYIVAMDTKVNSDASINIVTISDL